VNEVMTMSLLWSQSSDSCQVPIKETAIAVEQKEQGDEDKQEQQRALIIIVIVSGIFYL